MAGSRAPSGSLKNHASQARKATKQGIFSITKPAVPKIKPNTFTGDGSDNSSDSDSDSSSSDSESKNESAVDFQKRVAQQTPLSMKKTNGAKFKDDAKLSKTAMVNGLTVSVNKGPSMKGIKKEDTSSSSESESESSSDETAKKARAKGDEVRKGRAQSKSTSESEMSSDSDSESDKKKKTEAKPAPKSAAKVKSPVKQESATTSEAESSSAESENGSESESDVKDEDNSEDAAQQIEEQIKNEAKNARSQSSQARAQSSSKEPSKKKAKRRDAVSEDDDGDVEMMDQSLALTNDGKPTNVGDVPEFVAPDFHLRKLDGNVNAADVAGFFSKAQLEGKQVWYITAPASLPVTVVQDLTIPMDKAQDGMPVLSHNGDDYRMAFDNPAASSSFRLLIPNQKGDVYSLLEQPINQTMHFTRSETFPPEGPASVTTTQTVSTTKPARPQPEGLRARYTPLGVPSPKPTITAPVLAKSKAVTKVAEQDVAATSPSKASPSKKKRKHRDDGEDGPAATVSTPAQKNSGAVGKKNTPAEKSAKKQKTNNEAARKETPILPPLPSHGGESRPNSVASASSQPAPRSRTSISPGVGLPATQIPSAKKTPIPIPTLPIYPSAGPSSGSEETAKERKKAEKKVEKERKRAEKGASKAAEKTAAKVTQVPTPQYDARGVRLR